MQDRERGVIWEETIIFAPKDARMVFLSATLSNATEFADWVASVHQSPCHVVYTEFRPTPLRHFAFPSGGDGLYLVSGWGGGSGRGVESGVGARGGRCVGSGGGGHGLQPSDGLEDAFRKQGTRAHALCSLSRAAREMMQRCRAVESCRTAWQLWCFATSETAGWRHLRQFT